MRGSQQGQHSLEQAIEQIDQIGVINPGEYCDWDLDREAVRDILAELIASVAQESFEAGCAWMDGRWLSDDDVARGLEAYRQRFALRIGASDHG